MADERLAPDGETFTLTELSGAYTDVDDDPDNPDANWLTASGNNVDTAVLASFPTPVTAPLAGAALQEFRVLVRQYDEGQGSTPQARIDLYENGVEVRQGTLTDVPHGGVVLSLRWNIQELSNADGSGVECKVVGVKTGGGPSTRNTVEVGAIEWNECSSGSSTLYEYYNTNDDNYDDFYGVRWHGQTFTPATAHKITSVKIKAYRQGSPGTLTISIRATDGSGLPNGEDLCSGTIDADTFTTDSGGLWYEITLGAGAILSADTKYAIVARVTAGDIDNRIKWRVDASSATYPGGWLVHSSDSGVIWSGTPAWDIMFEDWGEPIATMQGKAANMAAKLMEARAI